jgi:hypothetical protein
MPVDYRAPLADMHFIVHQLIPLSRIQTLPGYEEVDDDLVNTILEEASKFARSRGLHLGACCCENSKWV